MTRCITGNGHPPRRGAAAVELAVLLPLLIFVFLAVVDFARVCYCTTTLDDCAKAGAFYASEIAERRTDRSLIDAAKQAAVADGTVLSPPLTADQVAVSVGTDTASVTVTYPFQTISFFPGIPRTVPLTRTVQMRTVSPGSN